MRSRGVVVVVGAVVAALGPGGASAQARVAVLADGTGVVSLVDARSAAPVARVGVGGRTSAVAVAPDGVVAFAGAGRRVVQIDLTTRRTRTLATLQGRILGLTTTPRGGTVLALRRARVDLVEAETGKRFAAVGLPPGTPRGAIAVSPDGTVAAVPLNRDRVALLGLRTRRLLRVLAVPEALGVTFTARGTLLSSAPRELRVLALTGGVGPPVKLGGGIGGGLGTTTDGRFALAASAPRGRRVAVVRLRDLRVVARVTTARGPGAVVGSPDPARALVADRSGRLSVLAPGRGARTATRATSGAPVAIAVQPGRERVGTPASDRLVGGDLRDLLDGLEGDDALLGGRDNDVLDGGPGADRLEGGAFDDTVFGRDGDDVLLGASGNDALEAGDGADRADGGTGDDRVEGGDGPDRLDGGDGDDRVEGGSGDDEIVEDGFGNDRRIFGGDGDDLIDTGRGSDLARGEDGDDRMFGRTGTENLRGGDGADFVDGGRARDRLFGDDGADTVRGDQGDDDVEGGAGADVLDGGTGDDAIVGGPDADAIVAGPGEDDVRGGSGDDTIRVADGDADTVDCGPGTDVVVVEEDAPERDSLTGCERVDRAPAEDATDAPGANVVSGTRGDDTLRGTEGADSMFGKAGADRIFGLGGDDYVDGEFGPDTVDGGPGDDIVAGRSNDDRLLGGDGNDTITGDRGQDRLDGGPGNDQLFGNLDDDAVEGGAGDDRINVVRGGTDEVRCGPGVDSVFADPEDRVAADCERVRR